MFGSKEGKIERELLTIKENLKLALQTIPKEGGPNSAYQLVANAGARAADLVTLSGRIRDEINEMLKDL